MFLPVNPPVIHPLCTSRSAAALAFVLLIAPVQLLAQSMAIEEVRVIGRRAAFDPVLNADSSEILAFDEQVSLNRTAGDWIEQLPGISLNGQGGLFQSYSVRGFSRWRIRTEVNGVPIITDRRAGNSVSFVPPDLLDQVRVEKSASSALYGSGAMGGVVSLGTRRASAPQVFMEGRSNDQQLSLTAVGGSETLSGGLSIRRADDAEAPNGDTLNSGYEQMAGLVSGRRELGALDLSYSWLPSYARDIGKSNRLYPQRRVSSYPSERHSVSQVELRAGSEWLLRGYHHFQDWDADVERVGERRNLTRYRAHTVGGLFQLATEQLGGSGAVGLEWVGRRGVEIADSEFDSQGTLLADQILVDGDEDTIGLFVDQRWTRNALTLNGGVRWDYLRQSAGESGDRDGEWSASAGLDYAVNEAWTLRAELASGYRFPGLSERYFNGVTPRGDVLGNPDLKAETRENVELALDYSAPRAPLRGSLSAYYSDLHDYIERYAISPLLVSYRNLDEASIQGVELDLSLQTGALSHRLSYQWQEGEDGEGNTLADLNPPGWRYFLSWQGDRRGVYSDLTVRESRDEFGADELPLDSAIIWNARITQQVSSDWQASLFLSNILDEEYRSTADDVAPLQPGRIVGLRLEWRKG